MALRNPAPAPRFLYHYTKAETALRYILPAMQIRLGRVRDTNDPWESRPTSTAVGPAGMTFESLPEFMGRLHAHAFMSVFTWTARS